MTTGTNDFQNWAEGSPGTNLMDLATFEASTARQNGVTVGLADETLYNRAARQSAAIAKLIGDFIAGQGFNCLDDANDPARLTALQNALTSYVALAAPAVVGSARGISGSSAGGVKTASWTIQEIIATAGLGGAAYLGHSLTLNFDGSTVGAGGMDTGLMPTSGDLSVYGIYNPTTATWSTLGCLGSVSNGPVYTGANIPSGYTASMLLWAGVTDSLATFHQFQQFDRAIYLIPATFTTGLTASTYTALSIATVVPAAAIRWYPGGILTALGSSGSNIYFSPSITSAGPGTSTVWGNIILAELDAQACPITTTQETYYEITGSGTWSVRVRGYEI